MRSGDIHKEKDCIHCKAKRQARLVRTISSSGVSMVFWECETCQKNAIAPGYFIPHEKITSCGILIETIPVTRDYRTQVDKCAVCGELGTEYHHWAPRYVFGEDADLWPGAYLCRRHHMEWHNRITPEMSRRRVTP